MKLSLFVNILLLLLFFGTCIKQVEATEQPNVLVFLVDDMGLMDSSLPFLTDEQGEPERYPLNDFYHTPNMERLAKQGIRFSNFYAMSVCSPTRISIMTGQTSARHHTTAWIRPELNNAGEFGAQEWQWEGVTPKHVMLPELLKKKGYQTIHCGKGHFGALDTYGEEPLNFGFDINIGGCAIGAPGSYYGTENFGKGIRRRIHRAVPGLDQYHGEEIYLTEALTREVNAAIEDSVKADKPFFAYMAHYAVHGPFQPDPRFVDKYQDAESKSLAAFASMIEGMDKSLGDILAKLDQLGVAENTLVFFLGDNGTDAPIGPEHAISCAAPLRGKKGTHYEGGMRVPFISAWAKPAKDNPHQQQLPIVQGEIIDQVGTVNDLFPTILALVDRKVPKKVTIDGMDLSEYLTGKATTSTEREFLMHFPHDHRSSYFTTFRKGDWKLIYHYRWSEEDDWQQHELFNLAEDPTESNNLASSHSEKLQQMMEAMINSLEQAGAQYPLADDKTTSLKPSLP
ncbi:N-acetylgalactosamine-6-sulfatase [Planctomycetales bacterium 10988]|nr:N-acetylgalactosamine-6-sulfatase [Planctomycetales bacterium 10988]